MIGCECGRQSGQRAEGSLVLLRSILAPALQSPPRAPSADSESPKGGGWEDLLVCPSEQGFTRARLSKPSNCTDLFALQNGDVILGLLHPAAWNTFLLLRARPGARMCLLSGFPQWKCLRWLGAHCALPSWYCCICSECILLLLCWEPCEPLRWGKDGMRKKGERGKGRTGLGKLCLIDRKSVV